MGPVMKRGALIVIEGVDRSGKSTQCRELVKSLESRNVPSQLINFPDRSTPIGGLIDGYLKNTTSLCDEAIHLLFSANRWENKQKMKKLLESGITLVVDRYSYSGIVYSSIKKTVDVDWCKNPETGLFKPDKVFLLTLPPEVTSQRPGYGTERYENTQIQQNVSAAFLKMSKEDDNWEVIDANRSIQELHQILLEKSLKQIELAQHTTLNLLNFNSNNQTIIHKQ